jgi:hypothetical protein
MILRIHDTNTYVGTLASEITVAGCTKEANCCGVASLLVVALTGGLDPGQVNRGSRRMMERSAQWSIAKSDVVWRMKDNKMMSEVK